MKCYNCKQEKQDSEFATKLGKRLKFCLVCYEEKYGPLEDKIKSWRAKKQRALRERNLRCKEFIKEILTNSKCMDCGYNNWIALEFDHRDPSKKEYEISNCIGRGSISKLKKEMEKCDIVCCNCHRIRTSKMFGHWRND